MAVSIDANQPNDNHVERWSGDPNLPCSVVPEGPKRAGFVATPYGELYFLNVRGTPEEMAGQLGSRLREQAQLGVIPFFADYLEKVLKNSPVKKIAGVLDWATHKVLAEKLKKQVPPEFDRMIRAFGKGAEIPVDKLYRAYLMPEIFLYILGTYHKMLGTDHANGLGTPPLFGCTSAITVPPKSETVLHGRNFDYFGVDFWDRFPTVAFHHPDEGYEYVSITTAGIIGGGITSMNSAGLTFAVHQHYPNRFDLGGVPVGVAGDNVIRNAATIEEAVEILKGYPPCSGWTYVMTEGDTGKAAIYEVAAGDDHFRWVDPEEAALGYANVYWGENLVDAEVDFYPEFRRCNYARQDRVAQCLSGLDEAGTTQDVARVIGDLLDPETGEERLLGPTIVNVSTVASVVFEPEHRRVWVGAGRSPACRGWYIPFTLSSPDRPHFGGPDMEAEPFLPFPGWHESPSGKAFEYYRRAVHMAASGEPDERLLVLIEHALALHPSEPYLRILAGLISLRLNRGRRAEGAFRRALDDITRPDRRLEVQLFLAWSMDLQKLRGTARHLYKEILRSTDADPIVKSRAHFNRWFRFKPENAAGLNIDFVYGGVP